MGTEDEKPPKRRRRKDSYSQAVRYRDRLARDLIASLEVHERRIADEWEGLLSPYLEDGERLELTTLVRVTSRMISDRLEQLAKSEDELSKELDQDNPLRRERRRWADELRRRLVDLRGTAKSICGKKAAENFLGLHGRTPRSLLALQRVGQRVVNRISDPEEPRPEPRHPGATFDWDWWKKRIEPPLLNLERTDRALTAEAGETETAQAYKGRNLALYDQQVHAAARWLMATYELLGFEKARKMLLPETRSRRRTRDGTGSKKASATKSDASSATEPTDDPQRTES